MKPETRNTLFLIGMSLGNSITVLLLIVTLPLSGIFPMLSLKNFFEIQNAASESGMPPQTIFLMSVIFYGTYILIVDFFCLLASILLFRRRKIVSLVLSFVPAAIFFGICVHALSASTA